VDLLFISDARLNVVLSEDVHINVADLFVDRSQPPYLVFRVNYRITPDEVKKAARQGDIAPLQAPIRYGTAEQLVRAIQNNDYPEGVTAEDLIHWMAKVGPTHLVAVRSDSNQSGGIEREQMEKVYETIFVYVRNKVYEETLASGGDEAEAKKAARSEAMKAIKAIQKPKHFGGDWMARKGSPQSRKHREQVIPDLIKYFFNVMKGPVIDLVKSKFSMFPADWQQVLFNNARFDIDERAKHLANPNKRVKKKNKIASKVDALEKQFVAALMGASSEEEPEVKKHDPWLTIYATVFVPIGNPAEPDSGFIGKFVQAYRYAISSKTISRVGDREGELLYQWPTGIQSLNKWVREMDQISSNSMTQFMEYAMGGANIVSVDGDGNIFFNPPSR
jgi:hypothetical protein